MNQRKREGDEERSQEYALNDFDGFVHRSGVWKNVAWKRKSAALYLFLPVYYVFNLEFLRWSLFVNYSPGLPRSAVCFCCSLLPGRIGQGNVVSNNVH